MNKHDEITDAELEAMQARADAATPGPWSHEFHEDESGQQEGVISLSDSDDRTVIGTGYYDGMNLILRQEDGDFIAAARTDVPRLIRALCAAWAENERLRLLCLDEVTNTLSEPK